MQPAMSAGFLASKTPVLGLRLYVVAAAAAALVILLLSFIFRCSQKRSARVKHKSAAIPKSCKEIVAVPAPEPEVVEKRLEMVEVAAASSSSSGERMRNIGWGRWYSLEELEMATGGFCEGNVIGQGGYGIVYRGVLPDFSVVAVKHLLNNNKNKGQAEKDFKVEVEAIGKVRHKNLVGLIGYCAEGPKRILVFEYIDNGNLEQWLHGDVGPTSPLTWDVRMKIAIGTAKGIAYLHEGLEPKVVHRDIKSSNILLDRQWNPKVSDFGLAKVLGPGSSFVATRVMGTFGYVAPEYASTGILNESNDVYSFGVLLMEIISGRSPIDFRRGPGEINLVDWFRRTVGNRREDDVVDPLIKGQPSPRALTRILLVCLRCTDMDALKRPKMGQVVHMLEGDEFPFRAEHRTNRETTLNSSNMPLASTERIMWR